MTPPAMRARHAPVDAELATRHLPGWDYADTYIASLPPQAPQEPAALARALLTGRSSTLRHLLRARDRLARLARLKPASRPPGALFPVLHSTPELIVLGLDDRHLDFRLLVARSQQRVAVTTLVRRHNRLGTTYFALFRPAHRLLVPRLMNAARERQWTADGTARTGPAQHRCASRPAEREPQ